MPNLDHDTIVLIFIAVTGLSVLLQAIILLAIFASVRKATKSLKEDVEDLRSSMMPIIYNSRDLFTRLKPQLESTVTDLAAMASGLREQSTDVAVSTKEILERVREQAARVDAMVSTALDSVDRASGYVTEAFVKPIKQLSGLLASAKAIIESLRESEPSLRERPVPEEQEPFI